MPLDSLRDPTSKGQEEWTLHGQSTQVPFYRCGAYVIWGATAMMLSELETLLAGATV